MPDGAAPVIPPDFDIEAELRRFARETVAARHNLPSSLLDEAITHDPTLQTEIDELVDKMRQQRRPSWLTSGIRFFDVTPSPEGEFVIRGNRYAVVNSYILNMPIGPRS